ncbi:MAG: hypothetical protein KAH48_05370 [Chlorobi bacterium]|nr:hypothetical protein [Chlorobiota bacterium]
MKKLGTNITALILILSLTVSYIGVDVYHHICGCSGTHSISVVEEIDCCCSSCETEEELTVTVNNTDTEISSQCRSFSNHFQLNDEYLINSNISIVFEPSLVLHISEILQNRSIQNADENDVINIPPDLNSSEQRQVVRILSLSSSDSDEDNISC